MPLKTIGVLALQGAFAEHINYLTQAGAELAVDIQVIEVKTEEQLFQCDALVIPGGESTAISLISECTGLLEPLRKFCQDPKKPVWGTCAGLIFLGTSLVNGREDQKQLGGIDIEVTRNAFGRQLDSKTIDLDFSSFIPGVTHFSATFIRAPVISKVGEGVTVLSQLEDTGFIVAVRQGLKLGTSFHPELDDTALFHKWFLTEFVL